MKDKQVYSCPECKRSFKTEAGLANHHRFSRHQVEMSETVQDDTRFPHPADVQSMGRIQIAKTSDVRLLVQLACVHLSLYEESLERLQVMLSPKETD